MHDEQSLSYEVIAKRTPIRIDVKITSGILNIDQPTPTRKIHIFIGRQHVAYLLRFFEDQYVHELLKEKFPQAQDADQILFKILARDAVQIIIHGKQGKFTS